MLSDDVYFLRWLDLRKVVSICPLVCDFTFDHCQVLSRGEEFSNNPKPGLILKIDPQETPF